MASEGKSILLFVLVGSASFVFRPTTSGDCSSDRCYLFAKKIIECAELELTVVPDFCPETTPNLTVYEEIDLSKNKLKRIGSSVFRQVQVSSIKVWDNDRKTNLTIHPKAFRGLENVLRNVSFRNSSIPELPSGLFRNLLKLRHIFMKDDRIRVLQKGVFRGARQVELVNLEDNLLQVLDDYVFGGLVKLKELRLSKNRIFMVHSNAFSSLRDLRDLDLSRNKIRDLQP